MNATAIGSALGTKEARQTLGSRSGGHLRPAPQEWLRRPHSPLPRLAVCSAAPDGALGVQRLVPFPAGDAPVAQAARGLTALKDGARRGPRSRPGALVGGPRGSSSRLIACRSNTNRVEEPGGGSSAENAGNGNGGPDRQVSDATGRWRYRLVRLTRTAPISSGDSKDRSIGCGGDPTPQVWGSTSVVSGPAISS